MLQVGLEHEFFSANPVDNTNKNLKDINENNKMTLQQAHTSIAKMFNDLIKEADKSRNLPSAQFPKGKGPQLRNSQSLKYSARATKRAAARRARRGRGGAGGSSDLILGMITEEVGKDFFKLGSQEMGDDVDKSSGVKANKALDGEEAMDMFMTESKFHQKTIHSALTTAIKQMEKELLIKGEIFMVYPVPICSK